MRRYPTESLVLRLYGRIEGYVLPAAQPSGLDVHLNSGGRQQIDDVDWLVDEGTVELQGGGHLVGTVAGI